MSVYYKLVLSRLEKFGVLLESDHCLPNVCTLVTGEAMRGSWWSHPLAQQIFAVNEQLEDNPDVLITKLISGKVTFVHRQLWRPLSMIGKAREEWQMENLSAPARRLLTQLDKVGSLTTNELGASLGAKPGDVARDLEKRLLIRAEQFHTASGAHSKLLETWETWAKRVGFRAAPLSPATAKKRIELRLEELNEEFGGDGKLPWQKAKSRVAKILKD